MLAYIASTLLVVSWLLYTIHVTLNENREDAEEGVRPARVSELLKVWASRRRHHILSWKDTCIVETLPGQAFCVLHCVMLCCAVLCCAVLCCAVLLHKQSRKHQANQMTRVRAQH